MVPDAAGSGAGAYGDLPRAVSRHLHRHLPRQVLAVIDDLVDQGAEGIILGCTEIELLVTENDCPVPVLPTTMLHAVAGLDAALSAPAGR